MKKETAFVYRRKSTDRDDLQQNSLEHQKNNCLSILKKHDLVLLDDKDNAEESKSAKTEYSRSWFNRMIERCKLWVIDYIVVDEPKRLSRNTIDTARLVDLMDKKLIRWVLSTSREYYSDNNRDKFLLQLDLSLSKMDNEDRAKDVRDKMLTAVRTWKWMWKAIFWYKNVWTKWKKWIELVEDEADIVRKAFIMRGQWLPLQTIADFINDKINWKWTAERVSNLIKNTKYFWLQQFWGIEEWLDTTWYKPIISRDLFNKANKWKSWVEYKKREDLPRYFSWILKDEKWINLYPYIKKEKYIYYHCWKRSKHYINISETWLFKQMWKHMKNYCFPKVFSRLSKEILKDYYKDKVNERESDLRREKRDLKKTQELLDSLIEKYLGNDVDKETYDQKKKELSERKNNHQEKIKAIEQWDDNVINIIEDLCELVENIAETYEKWNKAKKWQIIRAMQCELIINKDKELYIKDNKLFSMIKMMNFQVWYTQQDSNLRPLP